MSVPLDRLYNHLASLCNHAVLIYRFFPHGSKKLMDLLALSDYGQAGWKDTILLPGVICHDQEPLFFDQYSCQDMLNFYIEWDPNILNKPDIIQNLQSIILAQHLRAILPMRHGVYDKTLLIHSEENSNNLRCYEAVGFVGIYWWAHAAIALDWYRYAMHDSQLVPNFDCITKDFLIYNRAWDGTREYRLKFSEQLVNADLQSQCVMRFTAQSEAGHYRDFSPVNQSLAINRTDLENYFESCQVDSNASADYNNLDYSTTAIEVVLETLFDDARWHLTEKSLRPIACGRPFMLAATPGSLHYIRRYGFETFGQYINESYDDIQDPLERINAIISEMARISQLPLQEKRQLWTNLYQIADRNKQLFFSAEWQASIFDEFTNNFKTALAVMEQHKTGIHWNTFRNKCNADPAQLEYMDKIWIESLQHQAEIDQVINTKQ
jgi:hypothetical protein